MVVRAAASALAVHGDPRAAAAALALHLLRVLPPDRRKGAAELAEKAVREAGKKPRLRASRFKLRYAGEEPDKDGFYWRTIRGKRIPFKPGDDVKKTVEKHLGKKPDSPELDAMPQFKKEAVRKATAAAMAAAREPFAVLREIDDAYYGFMSALEKAEDAGDISREQLRTIVAGREARTLREYAASQKERAALLDKLAAEIPSVARAAEAKAAHEEKVKSYQHAYKTARKFYRATSVNELEKVLKDGGVPESGDYEEGFRETEASLTASKGTAVNYASLIGNNDWLAGVILVYEGDSVRKTKGFRPKKYTNAPGDNALHKTRRPMYKIYEMEVTVPRGSAAPKIAGVEMVEGIARYHPDLVKAAKDKGLDLTVVGTYNPDIDRKGGDYWE